MTTLFKAAKLRTLSPNLSASKIASSICLLMPAAANGKKYCEKKGNNFHLACILEISARQRKIEHIVLLRLAPRL